MVLILFSRMDKIILVNLVGEIALPMCARYIPHRREEQRRRGQTLLTINQMKGRMLARLSESRHKHQETHEMVSRLCTTSKFDEAVPKFFPLRALPSVIPLKYRNHILAGRV